MPTCLKPHWISDTTVQRGWVTPTDSNGNITCDPLRCFEIRYNLLNLSADVIGHDTEDTAAEGTLLSETVYYADGTRAGVTTPDDGYWTTRYIGSLIYEGEICTKEV